MKDTFGLYIHVPFCATRCGYCDFNTYTPGELGSPRDLTGPYLDALERELELAAAKVNRPADTIFVGGGTPSLLGGEGLTRVLNAARNTFGISEGAEISTESNPESTSPEFFAQIKDAGFTRVSLGMQSAASHVLQVLERAHTPGRPFAAAKEAKAAGFEHVNLDMIYATPSETDDDVRRTLDLALETGVDHISAYSLIVEDGTRMARKVKKGELPMPDQDTMARRYDIIADTLDNAGFGWYEVSNWAKEGGECRHNMIYWRDHDWWGAGPGAHSHLGDQRFYNVKLPGRYINMVGADELPIADTETLTDSEHHMEKIMLGLRLREGIDRTLLSDKAQPMIDGFIDRGLLADDTSLHVTRSGRLLADGIITDLLLAEES
ncbi:MAG: radical SAM family heme chaperone HemW [Corynebacterium casei]|uniref:radical SAM family heme chaperone HemW n=1 Tax=Corynebacterium casei TaxID=160386 RepID=UPI0026474451|nr:radical SAM family heme chaperone HemW [Corynebacterium casei]MDN5800260.1 radical SAM family heme chaperone HemW [Corynebacterium casei]MDN5922881.1 radical SAM family heme chaperone HemW [Corynebacterium casei]MDN6263170.1 radical SAM family heme chaperone HemW [Corynebacterium casei]MDN6313544.1 radical SAM family heme chaperone HemW [Corynebacterium casei]MDN6382740.1 radical SAM family heme chaperone HemW [Corynebacterium casei]